MVEFNSDDHYIYYCGQESLRRNGAALTDNKRLQNAILRYNLTNNRMILLCFQGKPFNTTVIQVYAPTTHAGRSWSWMVLWWPTRPSRTNTKKKKRCPFHHRPLECKSRKSRDTWSNRQVWPWSTKWSRAKANRVCQENALVIANTLFQQHNRWLYTWTSPDAQHRNQIDYILCSQRWRSSIRKNKTGSWLWLRSLTPFCYIQT